MVFHGTVYTGIRSVVSLFCAVRFFHTTLPDSPRANDFNSVIRGVSFLSEIKLIEGIASGLVGGSVGSGPGRGRLRSSLSLHSRRSIAGVVDGAVNQGAAFDSAFGARMSWPVSSANELASGRKPRTI